VAEIIEKAFASFTLASKLPQALTDTIHGDSLKGNASEYRVCQALLVVLGKIIRI
jgi:hypothetical protein